MSELQQDGSPVPQSAPERLAGPRRYLKAVGLDRAIFFTLLGRGWTSVAGIVNIFFVARFLSVDEQGYFYTFNSIIGLQVFFELGLAYVILQTASHERARLEWSPQGRLEGDEVSRARLASLLRLITRWYGIISMLFALVVIPAGLHFFAAKGRTGAPIAWTGPWIWVVSSSACLLAITPLEAFSEGCGLVTEIAILRFLQGITGMVSFWLVLTARMKLYAVPLISTSSLLVVIVWLLAFRRPFLWDLWKARRPEINIHWWKDIWPVQWRIGLSWLSGYFIFQLVTPMLFAVRGPAAAGRMGMSITASGAVSTVALAWVTTKSPTFGRLAALRKIEELDRLFFRALKQAVAVAGLSALLVSLLVLGVHHQGLGISRRLLEPLPFFLLIMATFVQVIVSAEAIYVRAFREERFLVVSLCTVGLIGASTYTLGHHFGAIGMMSGYLVINTLVGLGLGTWVLRRKRQELRSESAS